MKITFWGAARTVTGSMHELEVQGNRYLLDCGLYQGRRKESFERNSHFPFPPSSISAVLLSHAHIDHSGNLPGLVRQGFNNSIFTSPATSDLCHAMLLDSAFLQEKDAEFLNKKAARRRAIGQGNHLEEVHPLYTIADAERVFPLFREVRIGDTTEVGPSLTYRSYEAGHMLGSTAMILESEGVRLAFSGDVGRVGLPIIFDPAPLDPVDYLIMESTYGDRLHRQMGHAANQLSDVINRTARRGGRVIVPAFAVGRTQQLVVLLHELSEQKRIPAIPIYVDSPLAVNTTEVFRKHSECYDEETRKFLDQGFDPFGFFRLRYIREASESKALNDLRGPMVIISASGMCEAGRILHHLRNNIEDSRNTILITGFQAEHTLGRKIVEKQPEVPIFGDLMRLRAEVAKIEELSGHADQRELLDWMKPMVSRLKKVFLVHGEPDQSAALAKAIQREYAIEAVVPSRGDSFVLTPK
jgi:metallo-beta-lactamase family protein